MNEVKKLSVSDFSRIFGEDLSPFLKSKIDAANLEFTEISDEEQDASLIKIIDTLLDEFLVFSGEHRHQQWDKGWAENLTEFDQLKQIEGMMPKYFGKYLINRFEQRFIKAIHKDYEVSMLSILEYWLFEKYLKGFNHIYEFGCGTGHNLLRVREINEETELWGMDWASSSQLLIDKIRESGKDSKIFSHNFDFFKPDQNFKIKENSAIFTVAALEQVGSNYKDFVSYIIENKPDLCLHIEPIAELLDESVLLDYLSIKYFRKRNYLNGYLNYLRELESEGKIEIIDARRSYIGSFFIDGYSIVVWRVLKEKSL